MYQIAYADTLSNSAGEARARERDAISRSIEYMEAGEAAGPQSREAIVALNFLRQLWTVLLEDLADARNALPPLLRAQIISIGLWIMREGEHIRMESTSFRPIIDISKLIREGLK